MAELQYVPVQYVLTGQVAAYAPTTRIKTIINISMVFVSYILPYLEQHSTTDDELVPSVIVLLGHG
jgi:hypothetical protein